MRGTIARAELRRVLAATYHQVWWPDTSTVKFDGDELPVWDEATGNYLDPATGEVLPTWDQALDASLGRPAPPRGPVRRPVRRPGRARRVQGRHPVHRLPDQVPDQAGRRLPPRRTPTPQRAHAARLAEALRYQPCSPRARTGSATASSPRTPGPAWSPGRCKSKAHDSDHLGYAGRRVLVSRKWSGKTLADHRADRKDWLLKTLGISATDPARYAWEVVAPADPDHMEHARRLLHAVADRARWQAALAEARRRAQAASGEVPVTRRAA